MTRLTFIVCALALVACNDDAPVGFAPRGRLQGWSAGAGYTLYLAASGDAQQLPLSHAPIAADGTFALPMAMAPPAAAFIDTAFPSTCTEVPVLSPPHFAMATIDLVVQAPDGRNAVASIVDDMKGDSLVYSDREASAVGVLVCPQGSYYGTEYALRLAHGYSLVRFQRPSSGSYSQWFGTIGMPQPLVLAVTLD